MRTFSTTGFVSTLKVGPCVAFNIAIAICCLDQPSGPSECAAIAARTSLLSAKPSDTPFSFSFSSTILSFRSKAAFLKLSISALPQSAGLPSAPSTDAEGPLPLDLRFTLPPMG